METHCKANAVRWFEIYVQDMERAKKFYESVFETNLAPLKAPSSEDQLEMWSFTGDSNSYGTNGALVKMPGFRSGGNSIMIYFACNDCAVQETRVKKFGGKIEKSKFSIGEYGFISIAYDTEGNMIGLHSLE